MHTVLFKILLMFWCLSACKLKIIIQKFKWTIYRLLPTISYHSSLRVWIKLERTCKYFFSIVGYESFLWTSKWNLYYHSHEISNFAEKKAKKWCTCCTGEIKRDLTGPTHTPTFTIPLYSVCWGIWYVIFNSIFMICRYYYKIPTLVYLLI